MLVQWGFTGWNHLWFEQWEYIDDDGYYFGVHFIDFDFIDGREYRRLYVGFDRYDHGDDVRIDHWLHIRQHDGSDHRDDGASSNHGYDHWWQHNLWLDWGWRRLDPGSPRANRLGELQQLRVWNQV